MKSFSGDRRILNPLVNETANCNFLGCKIFDIQENGAIIKVSTSVEIHSMIWENMKSVL